MAIIAEQRGLLVVAHNVRTAAVAVVQLVVVCEFLLLSYRLSIRDTVFSGSADLLDLLHGKAAETVFTAQLLGSRIKFQIGVAVRAFVFSNVQDHQLLYPNTAA